MTTPRYSSAALSIELTASGRRVQLLPDGEFTARDGRPGSLPKSQAKAWQLDAAIAARLIARIAARQTPLVIDYEHQTLHAEKNGQPAPAAGYFRTVEYVPGAGLFATDVEWTARAQTMIDGGEYRFISPVFAFDLKTGAVIELQMAALTNNPALDGMDAVALSRLFPTPKEDPMNEVLAALLAALGLPADATKEQATAALTKLQSDLQDAQTSVAAAKTQNPDPAKFVPVDQVAKLQADLVALSTQVHGRAVDEVIQSAITAGKLAPALEGWARDLGNKDIAALRAYIDQAPAVPGVGGMQTGGKPPAGAGSSKDQQIDPQATAALATAYQAEQAKLGLSVSLTEAVRHVLTKKGAQ